MGGEEESERSTLTYVSYASPSEASGTQARRSDAASVLVVVVRGVDEDVLGAFCWINAMNPAMLSLEEGDGWT